MNQPGDLPSGPVIDIQGVRVAHWGQVVLDGVSLEVERGAVFALLGRNGSGKSSLLRCILGLHRPSAGNLRVFGRDPWRHRVDVLARVGFAPETANAPADLSAPQLASLLRRLHGSWDAEATAQRFERFQVPATIPFGRLSKGQQGAVMLALALGHAPDLLVLDDPTLGLDIIAREEIFAEVIGELAEHGTTVLMTTHEIGLAEGLASHVGILADNGLALRGSLEGLKQERGASLEQIYRACVLQQRRTA
jgi:ABC-2 type transport system ATP-binding protein